jgi:hypothetical protein
MIGFIDDHRGVYGVEPICRVLPIAPSTYYAHLAIRADPSKASARQQRDAALRPEIQRVWDVNFKVYGVRKAWHQLRREGFDVARCTVARLMTQIGLRGAVRGKVIKTTQSDTAAPCPQDKVNRQFRAPAPNILCPYGDASIACRVTAERLHLRFDLGRLCLRGLRDRYVCQSHRWLAGLRIGQNRLRSRCVGAGALQATPRW